MLLCDFQHRFIVRNEIDVYYFGQKFCIEFRQEIVSGLSKAFAEFFVLSGQLGLRKVILKSGRELLRDREDFRLRFRAECPEALQAFERKCVAMLVKQQAELL